MVSEVAIPSKGIYDEGSQEEEEGGVLGHIYDISNCSQLAKEVHAPAHMIIVQSQVIFVILP